jgi:hypothetical protein
MKRVFLLMVVPFLLVALGFAQTPTASSNTDPTSITSIKGCLGGSDGNYTFIEDNTGHNFKITTSTVDLKSHLGHDVTLIGQKASATVTSGAANSSFAVTSLNMVSEHCAAAAAAPAGSISTPVDTAVPPPAAAGVPAATTPAPTDTTSALAAASAAPAATVTTPAAEPAATPTLGAAAPAPTATVPLAAETASTPAAATIAPNATAPAEPAGTQIAAAPADAAATVPTPAETASAPSAAATIAPDANARPETVVTAKAATAHRTRMPADYSRPSETLAAAAPPAETATPVADAAKAMATDSAPSDTASTPDAAAATPAVAAQKGSPPWFWISIAVVVLIMGTLVPLINRWRKRRLLRQSDAQNLSFSHRASSDPGNSSKPVTRKAA